MSELNVVTETLTTKEAANFLRYSTASLRRWRWLKTGPNYIKISRVSIRYRLSDLKKWLEERLTNNG